MATSEMLRKARLYVPITALVVAVSTLISCVVIAKTSHVYLSGMAWPFFSFTGRDKPAYYVFCTGLTITAVLLIATWTFNYQYQHALLVEAARNGAQTTKHQRMAAITLFAGVVSVFGLSLLAFFDTAMHSQIHQITAYWFFAWEVVATVTNTFVSKRIYELAVKAEMWNAADNYHVIMLEANGKTAGGDVDERTKRSQRRRRTHRIQLLLNVIFFFAFVVYIPWNIVAPTHCPALTVKECLDRDLGDTYCTVTMRVNETDTNLSNCENNLAKVQIRALGQLVCVLTLIGYCVTFVSHDYDDAEQEESQEAF